MFDDVVTRLRGLEWDTRMGRLNPDDIGDIIFDCANKIQNLRAENKAINTRLEEVSRERDRWMSQTF